VTKVRGAHTIKSGFYNGHALKSSNTQRGSTAFPGAPFGNLSFAQDTVGTNPYDMSFGFANAAIGTLSSFMQSTNFVETKAIYNNSEAYIQDNWKVNRRLTLDYGVRFVHQQPQPTSWVRRRISSRRNGHRRGAAVVSAWLRERRVSCSGTNRQAMNPQNGGFLGEFDTRNWRARSQ
jgi:outer membrane receptor protein involved in Fe transport